MWFIGVEVEQEMSAPPPKKNPGSAPVTSLNLGLTTVLCSLNGLAQSVLNNLTRF